jgi:toxin ParE1/3/4
MPSRLKIRPRAIWDIDDHAEHLARFASDAVAERFHRAVEEAITHITAMPEAGSPWESENGSLLSLRFRPLHRFKNHVLFYRLADDTVEIVRLLHSSQNLEKYLEEPSN